MPPTPITRGTQVTYQGIPYTVRSVDGNVLALESDDGYFCRFAHVSSVIVCPPPAAAPAVDSLPAPAAAVQGVGIHSYLWHQVFFTDPVGQWLCMGGHGCRWSIKRSDQASMGRVQRRRA